MPTSDIDARIFALWRRLETWARENAPAMLSHLRGPVTPNVLAALEREIGITLPADLAASLGIHDGERIPDALAPIGGVWKDGGRLLSAGEILQTWRQERALDARLKPRPNEKGNAVEGPVKAQVSSPRRVAFMDSEGTVIWYLDFDPAPGGRLGQVVEVDLEGSVIAVVADSYADFLEAYVDRLEGGDFVLTAEGLPVTPRELAEDEAALRRGRLANASPTFQQVASLPPGTEIEVVGVIAGVAGEGRHELALRGGTLLVTGWTGTPSRSRLIRATIRVGTRRWLGLAGPVCEIVRVEHVE